ncbi:MAG: DUF192 domain-containing protein [Burkholderiales bacterium]
MTKLLISIAIVLAVAFPARADPLVTYPLSIGKYKLRVEVASTPEARQAGLMHRKSLGENQGMVFVFERAGLWGMWMKNTYVPLSVAFIGEDGRILNIEDMTPLSEDSHSAAGPARYALEVNKGWFKQREIKPGNRVLGLKNIPQGQ